MNMFLDAFLFLHLGWGQEMPWSGVFGAAMCCGVMICSHSNGHGVWAYSPIRHIVYGVILMDMEYGSMEDSRINMHEVLDSVPRTKRIK